VARSKELSFTDALPLSSWKASLENTTHFLLSRQCHMASSRKNNHVLGFFRFLYEDGKGEKGGKHHVSYFD
jgi:hypothetical protein